MKSKNQVSGLVFRSLILLTTLLSSFMHSLPKPAKAEFDPTYGWHYFSGVESMMPAPHYFDLELDEEGNPHLAYFKDGINEDYLIYKYFDGVDWQTIPLDVPGVLDYVSLELDESGHPHIAFHDGVSKLTIYAYFDGTGWFTVPATPPQELSSMFIDLALTTGGIPKIALFSETASSLLLATYVDNQFSYETVDSGGYYNFISLAVDEADQPSIAYCEGTAAGNCGKLKFAEFGASDWDVAVLETAGLLDQSGNYASLAVDSAGNPHISYVSKESSIVNVKYASFSDHGWQIDTIESWRSGVLGLYTSIALDDEDKPSVAYYDPLAQSPDYQWWDGSDWNTNMDLDQTQMGTYMNLELDASGYPTLAFWDIAGSTIAVAEYAPAPDLAVTNFWVDETDSFLTASIRNDGQGTYYDGEIHIGLYVDGVLTQELWPFSVIEPGNVFPTDFVAPTCTTASPTMEVEVCLMGEIDYNPANNCLVETWPCDASPLTISNFTISGVSMSGFTASWTTNRPADTTLRYTDGQHEQVYYDEILLTDHTAVISGLSPHKVYYAQGFSTDGAGINARSLRETVRTLAGSPGSIPGPSLYFERQDTRFEVYNFSAEYPDTSNIERVDFYLDGALVGTDFTPESGTYSLKFAPVRGGYTRDEFYSTGHTLTTNAFAYGAVSPDNYEKILEFQRENYPIESLLLTPDSDSTLTIFEDTVPAGTPPLNIDVYAQQFEWECTYGGADGLPACEDVGNPVSKVEFYINGGFKTSDLMPEDGVYRYSWNVSGSVPGDYQIKAKVIATDGGVKEHFATIHIVKHQTVLRTDRTITRENNTFRVKIRVFNDSSSMDPVLISSLDESVVGFQPINQDFGTYIVQSSTSHNGDSATASILLDQPQTLQPGENLEFYYYVVPILFPNMETVQYSIGTTTLHFELLGSLKTKTIEKISQVWDGGAITVAASAANAFAASDYLLITAPTALKSHYIDDDADKLMADMAWLAQLKQGVLAFWDPTLGKENLESLLQDQSAWTSRLHPKFSQQYGGYVLIVGETEVIPSSTTGPFDNDVYVNYSDHAYSATDSGAVLAPPDLLVGRIIGDSAADLDKVLLNSIITHTTNSYERSQMYLGIGRDFRGTGNAVENDLSDIGYSVSMHHYEEELYFDRFTIDFEAHDGLAHADVDSSGTEHIIWAQDATNKVFFVNPIGGTSTFAFNLDFEVGDCLAAGDVDADPQREIIIADMNSTIRTYDLDGTQVASFSTGVQMWDKVAVGDVLYSNPGDEIVLAKGTDFLKIFSYTGAILENIDLLSIGYNFSKHDNLQIGNMTGENTAGLEEIVFTDILNNKVIVISGNGVIKQTLQITLQEGDALEVANVQGGDLDSIILMNSKTGDLKTIDYGVVIPLHGKSFDGLVSCQIFGSSTDSIYYFDQSGHFYRLDMDYPEYSRQLFLDNIHGSDLVWFFAHGAPDGIWPIITDTIPDAINLSRPIVNSWSCKAGAYEGAIDDAFAENFMQAGAGVYLGSTEIALSGEINAVNNNFYSEYWDLNGWKLAEAFARRESDLLVSSEDYALFMGWFVNEFNYYGDPKFDILSNTVLEASSNLDILDSRSTTNMTALASQLVTIDLPTYTVTGMDGSDIVEIPPDSVLGTHSGTHYLAYDQYRVPIYIHTIEIPAGQEVQNVTLTAMDNKISDWGLNLPISEYMEVSNTASTPGRSAQTQREISTLPGHDWSPNFDQPFRWEITPHQEGGATLKLVLYPFYYDPAAQYSEYYRHFEFNVETLPSALTIIEAGTDKAAYSPGDTVNLSLSINNGSTTPIDAVVSGTILKGSTGEPVDGFILTAMPAIVGSGVVDLSWQWTDALANPAGDYTIEIVIEDMLGNQLAQRSLGLSLGETLGEITAFDVPAAIFEPGELIEIDMTFANTGDLPISGEGMIQVQAEAGEIISTYEMSFTDLAPGESLPFSPSWDSTGATDGDYRVLAFVKYDSQTTPVVSRKISTNLEVFLPLILR